MKKHILYLALSCIFAGCGCDQKSADTACGQPDFAALNEQAREEYLQPIRPGYIEGNPYWNVFAKRFMYAPAFNFKTIENAASYRFTLSQGDRSWSFAAETPNAPLSEVWDSIPVGQTKLIVEALSAEGKTLGEAGTRSFFRAFPFEGPYTGPARDYREAALKGAYFVHNIKAVQHWIKNKMPDMSFENNCYACKIIGATVRLECFLAKEMPELKEEALTIARNAAECLMNAAQPEGTPLAYFPPTYYLEPEAKDGWPHHVYTINKGKTMLLEAVAAGNAYLDLYDMTGEKKYFDETLHILDTYQRLQNPDGSWPIKIEIATGKTTDNSFCTPTPLLMLVRRVNQLGVDKYNAMAEKGEKWVVENTLKEFNLTGQFEDQRMEDLKPYENLTHCTTHEFANYLLTKPSPTPQEIETAKELTAFGEDQFIHWDIIPDKNGFKSETVPCVHEQYFYEVPVDASSSEMAESYMLLYEATGDKLCLAKATALLDAMTIVQNACNGQIPTTWEFNSHQWNIHRTFWINCTYSSVVQLLKLHSILNAEKNQ